MIEPPVRLKNRRIAALLAFLVPGLGHLYQGRVGKGILYGLCILCLYITGFVLGDGRNVYWAWISPMKDPDNFRLHFLGQFWVGLGALPALIQATLIHYGHSPLFNGFMAAPVLDPSMAPETREIIEEVSRQMNGLYRKGNLVEIGALYTTIAGLLNILAIYDAYDGPAFVEEDEDAAPERPATASASAQVVEAPAT